MPEELFSVLDALRAPAIFATHDQADAKMLADNIAVLRDAAIVQGASAKNVYARPANSFLARIVGMENVLGAVGELATVVVGDRKLYASVPARSAKVRDTVCLGIRGERVTFGLPESEELSSHAVNRFDGRITSLRNLNPLVTVKIDCGFPRGISRRCRHA